MRMLIDTRNGISEDIFCGGLISLGASEKIMEYAMEYAGNHSGKTGIKVITEECVTKYRIKWKKSETYREMTTPTGASIIACCDAKKAGSLSDCKFDSKSSKRRIIKKALSKGTKNPPEISFYLGE